VKILFFMRHSGYTRNFESTLRLLAERGHDVHLAYERREKVQSPGAARQLLEDFPNITAGPAPRPSADAWRALLRNVRLTGDYLRYLEPNYRQADKLRERAAELLPPFPRWLTSRRIVRTPAGLAVLRRALRALEEAAPPCDKIGRYIAERQPDLVLVTPLVEIGSWQPDYLRSAREQGVRTALLVHSWDNLTNKGLIRESPDLVAVWNAAQKQEAVELHGQASERVVVTGAVSYDHWFGWQPGRDGAAFRARVGLPVERAYVLYLCSSSFIAPDEAGYVQRWLAGLRSWGGVLGEVGVLVRPHPQHARQWVGVELGEWGPVAVWPRGGADPVTVEARREYYDSLYHASAVVGVNTSALIESAIVGRGVYTLLSGEHRGTQEGTLHFGHLRAAGGGPLVEAGSWAEHYEQLAGALAAGAGERERARLAGFVERFVRPYGLGEAATPRLVEALEGLASGDEVVAGGRSGPARVLGRLLSWPLALAAHGYRVVGRDRAARPPEQPVASATGDAQQRAASEASR
jgi:hypothetical protein